MPCGHHISAIFSKSGVFVVYGVCFFTQNVVVSTFISPRASLSGKAYILCHKCS